MSKQLTVRLPDRLVDFIDQLIAQGRATSRAAVISGAIERERRRAIAERDAAILSRHEDDDDLDELASYAAEISLEGLA